jgi:hypothetical protein
LRRRFQALRRGALTGQRVLRGNLARKVAAARRQQVIAAAQREAELARANADRQAAERAAKAEKEAREAEERVNREADETAQAVRLARAGGGLLAGSGRSSDARPLSATSQALAALAKQTEEREKESQEMQKMRRKSSVASSGVLLRRSTRLAQDEDGVMHVKAGGRLRVNTAMGGRSKSFGAGECGGRCGAAADGRRQAPGPRRDGTGAR